MKFHVDTTGEHSGYGSLDAAIEDGAAKTVDAYDARGAAAAFIAAWDNDGDYIVSNGGEVTVWVRERGRPAARVQTFLCYAEPTVTYKAMETTDE